MVGIKHDPVKPADMVQGQRSRKVTSCRAKARYGFRQTSVNMGAMLHLADNEATEGDFYTQRVSYSRRPHDQVLKLDKND